VGGSDHRGAAPLRAAELLSGALGTTVTRIRLIAHPKPIPSWSVSFAFLSLLITGSAQADPAQTSDECPFNVSIPFFSAGQPPEWKNWDSSTLPVTHGGRETEISPKGLLCVQTYKESTIGVIDTPFENMLEFTRVTSEFKQSWQRQGAEIIHDSGNDVVAHLTKGGKDYWLEVSLPHRGIYRVTVLQVEPFNRTLLPPGSN